jgi:hypothetical protein
MAEADTTTVVPATNGTAYTPFNPAYTSPTFQVAQAQSLAGLYGSCFNIGAGQLDPLVNSITQLTTGKAPGGVLGCANVKAPCNSSVSNSPPSCNRSLEPSAMKAVYEQAFAKAGAAACCVKAKESQLQEALKELSCISQQNDLLANQIGSMQAQMQQNFQSIEQNLSKIETVLTDRKNQLDEVNNRLNGGPGGRMGLLNLKKQLDQVVNVALPTAVKDFNDSINNSTDKGPGIFQQQEILQQEVKDMTMGLTKQCMSTTATQSFPCYKNTKDQCSFVQELENSYYEKLRRKNKDDTSNRNNSGATKAQLDALFSRIFADMSSDITIKPIGQDSSQDQQSQSNGSHGIQTPLDLQTKYGSELAGLSIDGLDLQTFFQNEFAVCYRQAQSTVEKSKTTPNSDYLKAYKKIEKNKQDIRDKMSQFLSSYSEIYKQVYSEFGVTMTPLDLTKCTASTTALNGELNCVKDLQTQLTSIYNGSGSNSSMTVQMKGNSTDPVTAFNFTCSGVDGCITTMQNLVTNLTTEHQKLTQTKKTFIMQANQSLESFKSQMSQVLSVQNQALQSRLNELKKVLSANGVTDPLTTQSVQRRPLEKDENGLYKMPEDLLATIGGDLKPPMIDPASGSFDNARSSIARTIQENEQKGAEAEQVMAMITQEQKHCAKEAAEVLEKKSLGYMDEYTRQCLPSICVNKGKTAIQELIADVLDAAPSGQDLKADVGARTDGWGDQCDALLEKNSTATTGLSEACANLNVCRNTDVTSDMDKYCATALGQAVTYYDGDKFDSNACIAAKSRVSDKHDATRSIASNTRVVGCDAITRNLKATLKKAGGDNSNTTETTEAN